MMQVHSMAKPDGSAIDQDELNEICQTPRFQYQMTARLSPPPPPSASKRLGVLRIAEVGGAPFLPCCQSLLTDNSREISTSAVGILERNNKSLRPIKILRRRKLLKPRVSLFDRKMESRRNESCNFYSSFLPPPPILTPMSAQESMANSNPRAVIGVKPMPRRTSNKKLGECITTQL